MSGDILSTSSFTSIKFFIVFMAIPYWIGTQLSPTGPSSLQQILPSWLVSSNEYEGAASPSLQTPTTAASSALLATQVETCYQRLLSQLGFDQGSAGESVDAVTLRLHRNGQLDACNQGPAAAFLRTLRTTIASMTACPDWSNKYSWESFLTQVMQSASARDARACASQNDDANDLPGLYSYCDMGEHKTPELLDHDRLVPVMVAQTTTTVLPCHFHDEVGRRITSPAQLGRLLKSNAYGGTCNPQDATCSSDPGVVELYAVPAGRVFMFAPKEVGHTMILPHVQGGEPMQPVTMQVLSREPRVWELHNFFSRTESADLVERALRESRDSYRIKRSSTGASGYNINKQRTSESGFDTHGATAVLLKRRCFDVLGFDEYVESHGDGLQILRYNISKAYMPHMDWIEGNDRLEHNYDSAGKGGNRFATILLYMSDLGESDGGETVFPHGWPAGVPESERIDDATALRQLRESAEGSAVEKNSWEERMVVQCRTRLAVRPHSARAILFYSQLPNGEEDETALHGACPVLSGQKYAANLWVWSTPRDGYPGNPKNAKFLADQKKQTEQPAETSAIFASFRNTGSFGSVELMYGDTIWTKLTKDAPTTRVQTYPGHVWSIRENGNIITTWTIGSGGEKEQVFEI